MRLTLKNSLARFPILSFFVLAFLLNWPFWGLRAYLSYHDEDEILMTVLHLLGAFSPCAAGMLVCAAVEGRAGLRRMFAPYLYWRVNGFWYAFVILFRPIAWLAALGIYIALGIQQFTPQPVDWGFFTVYLLSQFLVVGLGEEGGWMGFAYPRLKARWGFWVGNLLLGVIWGLWHFPMFLTVGDSQNGSSLLLFVMKMTALRFMFSLSLDQTGSLLMPGFFHAFSNVLTELVPLSMNDLLAIGLMILFAGTALLYFNRKNRVSNSKIAMPLSFRKADKGNF